MFGIIPFYKPVGLTSYDVVRKIKGWTGEKKVGHGGTLDPLAEGVLVLGIGSEGTKQLSTILNHTIKTYYAVIELGSVSSTDDREGPITSFSNVRAKRPSLLSREEIENCLNKFIGEILQTPPVYSAVKIQGIAAYKRTRKGERLILEPKRVVVKEIKLLDYNFPEIKIELTCGSGFYVRALARDVGEELGVGGYLKELKRTRIWSLENSEVDFKSTECLSFKDIENNFIEMRVKINGKVQGVGFRMFAQEAAKKLGLYGCVRNLSNGLVEVVGQGSSQSLQEFLVLLKKGPPFAQVEALQVFYRTPLELLGQFIITQ